MVIGSVVPGTAKIEGGRGIATILLSKAKGVEDTVQKIREGVIRNISVGYWLHKVVKTEADDGSVARHDVVDWEPLEISAVPVPADAGSQIRSSQDDEGGTATRSCLIVTRNPASRPTPKATQESRMATRTPKNAPKNVRTAPTAAEVEAEKKRKAEERKAALRAAARDEDEAESDSEDERDEDTDEARAEDDEDGSDDEGERAGDDEDNDEERESDDDTDADDGERSAATLAARRAADAAVKAERVRSTKINEMAERAGLPNLGRSHIAKGTSVKRFGELVLERMLKKQEQRGNATLAGNGAEEIGRERSAGRPGRDQREMTEGEAHWRRVAGKPAKAA